MHHFLALCRMNSMTFDHFLDYLSLTSFPVEMLIIAMRALTFASVGWSELDEMHEPLFWKSTVLSQPGRTKLRTSSLNSCSRNHTDVLRSSILQANDHFKLRKDCSSTRAASHFFNFSPLFGYSHKALQSPNNKQQFKSLYLVNSQACSFRTNQSQLQGLLEQHQSTVRHNLGRTGDIFYTRNSNGE